MTERRLTRGARILGFDVSRSGAIVAVQVVPGGTQLVVFDSITTSGPRPAHRAPAPGPRPPADDWADPRWSPDGRFITAVRVRGGWHDIVLLSADGALIREVTRDPSLDLSPVFTTDGRWITWSREVEGIQRIVRTRAGDPATPALMIMSQESIGAYMPVAKRDSVWYLAYRGDGYALAASGSMPGLGLAEQQPQEQQQRSSVPDSTPDRPYSPFPALLPQYWIPLAYVAEGGGWVGAITSGTDALNRHGYTATLELGTGLYGGQWRGGLAWNAAGPGTTRVDLALSRNPRGFIADTVTGALGCCFSDDNASAGISFVRRGWRSSASMRTGVSFDKDGTVERAGATIGATWSRTESAPVAISTLDGTRLSASLRFRRRLDRPVLNSADLSLRASFYRSQGGGAMFARPVFAMRAAATGVAGNDNVAFAVGGESGGSVPILPGFISAGISRAHPVRGYPGGFLVGRHVASLSLEERLPLALIGRNLGLLPVGLEQVHATVFADGGMAWSRAQCGAGSDGRCARAIASIGAELGTVIAVGYDFGILVRGGAGVRLKHASGVGGYAAVGASF